MKFTVQDREAYAYTGGKPLDTTLPVAVFIHGAMHDHSVWALQSRSLAHHGHAVLALDLPGHGRSAGPAPATVEEAALWVVMALQAVGISQPALVGHSLGSLIALEAAALLANQATHLVMVGAAFPMKVSPALLGTAKDDPLKAIDMVNAYSHSTLAAKPSAPAPGFWLHGANRALMRRLQSAYAASGHGNLFHQDFVACDSYEGGLNAARRVRCPVRLILGASDQMTPPRAAEALAHALKADTVVLPGGHSMMGEMPASVLNGISTFLSRTP
jgi:pimeloyl-ACP methyl ester carboxylesterase